MAMRQCKECKSEVSSKAKKCPSCGIDQRSWMMRHKFMSFIGFFVAIIALVAVTSGGDDTDSVATPVTGEEVDAAENNETEENNEAAENDSAANENEEADNASNFEVGETATTEDLEVTVTVVEERDKVGDDMINAEPSEGGMYVAVQWTYKNISDEAIGSFSMPSLNLVDENENSYSSDLDGSMGYAMEVDGDSKVLSELNPGISVTDSSVFEVSEELFDASTWTLLIKADEDIVVNLQ